MCDAESGINDNTTKSKHESKLLTEKCVNPEENVDKLEVNKLKEKYGDLICAVSNSEKENKSAKKKKGGKKKRKNSDPVVKNIAELMLNNLKIISPDKPYKGAPLKEAMNQNCESNKTEVETSVALNEQEDLQSVESENSQDYVERNTLELLVDSEESQDAFEKKPASKKKHFRLSTIKSPKGKKFKDCSQQSKLNGFFQIKSPPPEKDSEKEMSEIIVVDDKEQNLHSRIKFSNSLFKSSKSSKSKDNINKNNEKELQNKDDNKGENIELQNELLNKNISNDKSVNLCSDEGLELMTSPVVRKRGRPRKNASETVLTPKSKKLIVGALKSKPEENSDSEVVKTPKSKARSKAKAEENSLKLPAEEKEATSPCEKKITPTRKDNSGGTQTTPQRNAFQFMMDQRNKVIGSNSPGKEPTESPVEDTQENKAKKERLAKRKKQFSEWNESKGIKRKLEEEEREEYAEMVLESRAKLMKEMLKVGEANRDSEESSLNLVEDNEISVGENGSAEVNEKPKKRIKKKPIEDDDRGLIQVEGNGSGLKKRKRKRMIQIESTSESSNDSSFMQSLNKRKKLEVGEENTPKKGLLSFINVTPKNNEINEVEQGKKKRTKKKKHSLSVKKEKSEDLTDDDELSKATKMEDENSRESNISSVISIKSIKNKLLIKLKNPLFKDNVIDISEEEEEKNGEKGDEIRKSARKKVVGNYVEEDSNVGKVKGKGKKEKEKKMAPVFLKSVPKPKEDPAVVQARMEFLRSGVPSALKKIAEKQISFEEIDFNAFPSISHVQQKTSDPSPFWNLTSVHLDLKEYKNQIHLNKLLTRGEVTDCDFNLSTKIDLKGITKNLRYKSIIEEIKQENEDYPVYRSFRLSSEKEGKSFEKLVSPPKTPTPVKRKRGRPKKKSAAEEEDVVIIESDVNKGVNLADYAMWTEKYKPRSSQEIIGNYKSVTELRDWLNGWIEYSKEDRSGKKRRRCDSSDFESTDGESRDSVKLPCNTMIVQGPLGTGKSAAVYAVCQELGVNVLEINASSKRTGKKLLQEMQEATQSHQVGKKETNSLAAFLHKDKIPKEIQEAKSKSESKMCILLIEDADIVFEQDEGFIYALSQLILTSKRPIILLTSNVDCNHMQKFTSQYPVLNFDRLSAVQLSVWLQIVCLVEGVYVDKNAIGELLEWNEGDVRRTLLQLQFWVQSGGVSNDSTHRNSLFKIPKKDSVFEGFIHEDDKNSILNNFKESDSMEQSVIHTNCIKSFLIKKLLPFPVNLGLVWWNLPDVLDLNREKKVDKNEEINELRKVSDVYDALAFGDVLYRAEGFDVEFEPRCSQRFEEGMKEGLNLKEDTVEFKTDRGLSREIAHFLIEKCCKVSNPNFDGSINMGVPTYSERRRRRKQLECEQDFLSVLPTSYAVQHSAFYVDYFPALRTISRNESERAQSNTKRGNRFYSYLKTLNMNASKSILETACNTMTNASKEGDTRIN